MRKVANAVITAFTGNGNAGSTGDGGLATSAELDTPGLLATDASGNVYIADTGNNRVRKVASGLIGTVAGTHIGPPGGMAVNAAGVLFVSEPSLQSISAVTPDGSVTLIAGNGSIGFSGDGGLAPAAMLAEPGGIWLDSKGDILVADTYKYALRTDAGRTHSAFHQRGRCPDRHGGNAAGAAPHRQSILPGRRAHRWTTDCLCGHVGDRYPIDGNPTTDATGMAGIGVTLGGTAGPVVISATLAGLPPVQFHLTSNAPPIIPAIATGGISGAGGSTPPVADLSPGGLASVYGFNFAPAGTSCSRFRTATSVNGSLPTQLAGVCVQVAGVPAFLTYVGSTQVNFQVPNVPVGAPARGSGYELRRLKPSKFTAPVAVPVLAATPEFLYWVKNANGTNPVIAINAVTGAYVGAAGLIAGVTFIPAQPGDYLNTSMASRSDRTDPAIAPGTASATIANTTNAPSLMLGGAALPAANLLYAGASPGSPGLYQMNIQVPAGLASGDYPLVLTLGAFSTPTGAYLTVQ